MTPWIHAWCPETKSLEHRLIHQTTIFADDETSSFKQGSPWQHSYQACKMSSQEPIYHGCGLVGTTKRDCEQCNKDCGCTYCQSKNHEIKDCPRIEPCRLCNTKSHKPIQFPQVTGRPQSYARSLRRNLPAPQSSYADLAGASREATIQSLPLETASLPQQSLSIIVPTVPHNNDEWKEILRWFEM